MPLVLCLYARRACIRQTARWSLCSPAFASLAVVVPLVVPAVLPVTAAVVTAASGTLARVPRARLSLVARAYRVRCRRTGQLFDIRIEHGQCLITRVPGHYWNRGCADTRRIASSERFAEFGFDKQES